MSERERSVAETERRSVDPATARILVISAPSGAGKTSIAHRLLEHHPDWRFSVSATTRPKRPGEQNDVDYHFLTEEEFKRRAADGELVEWEEIFGAFYGTLKDEVARLLAREDVGRVIFDVDVKGALSIRRAFPDEAYLIFVAPPSMEELRKRLTLRRTETPESLARRIDRATMEMGMQGEFDLIVVNDEIERAVNEIEGHLTPRGAGEG